MKDHLTLILISSPFSISLAAMTHSSPVSSLTMFLTEFGPHEWLMREKWWNIAVLVPPSSTLIPLVRSIRMYFRNSTLGGNAVKYPNIFKMYWVYNLDGHTSPPCSTALNYQYFLLFHSFNMGVKEKAKSVPPCAMYRWCEAVVEKNEVMDKLWLWGTLPGNSIVDSSQGPSDCIVRRIWKKTPRFGYVWFFISQTIVPVLLFYFCFEKYP